MEFNRNKKSNNNQYKSANWRVAILPYQYIINKYKNSYIIKGFNGENTIWLNEKLIKSRYDWRDNFEMLVDLNGELYTQDKDRKEHRISGEVFWKVYNKWREDFILENRENNKFTESIRLLNNQIEYEKQLEAKEPKFATENEEDENSPWELDI